MYSMDEIKESNDVLLGIMLPPYQHHILPEIQRRFERIALCECRDGIMYLFVVVGASAEDTQHVNFLRERDVHCVNVDRLQEDTIRDFFRGASIGSSPIEAITFRHGRFDACAVCIMTRYDEVCFTFPLSWETLRRYFLQKHIEERR